ncbi:MAG: heterodisulfide reductase [Candidatus Abyssobacteria bacterium SURF_17]|uniref:Heterodisulfide reductase n=1 Tax=Candidatus Abyssobacteria bacterium SURF_17 TaxID=2093361 RepID=A0A419F044_9BACT|nr:MAG: heterodisulfide reductase [Candidatus Abyssubacteria bacterium SURF_17]
MELGLFLGCNTPAIRPDVERAIRLTMPKLGVDLIDLEGYVCCPAFGTFPSTDEDSHLAVSGWNLSLAEQKGLDLLVECGSCYSSLRVGRELILHDEKKRARVNELLQPVGRTVEGKSKVRHITDVLYNDVGVEKISKSIDKPLDGLHAVVQYPCHTLFPSELVGFDSPPARPRIMRELVEALGAKVDSFSREYQCCGGAGGFHGTSAAEARGFAQTKFDAIKSETQADFMVVSCITCLMFLDNVQKELSEGNGKYDIPVFDYNQILALCMGFDPKQVAPICTVSRDRILERF